MIKPGGSIEIGHHITALIMVKPRGVADLVRLVECSRFAAYRHLHCLEEFGLVTKTGKGRGPFTYTWGSK
jgi:DNA-binding IclR family transcriptional regulator